MEISVPAKSFAPCMRAPLKFQSLSPDHPDHHHFPPPSFPPAHYYACHAILSVNFGLAAAAEVGCCSLSGFGAFEKVKGGVGNSPGGAAADVVPFVVDFHLKNK